MAHPSTTLYSMRSSAFSLKSTKKIVGAIGCNTFFALKNYEHETETQGNTGTTP